jgi:hypothetical protein
MMSSPLNELLPEIYPLIAAHLPLHSTPSTLLSLALVNHDISEIVLPLLASRLLLKNESHARKVIQRLLDEPQRGHAVREIQIYLNSSSNFVTRQNPFVFTGLIQLITTNSLPYIHTLGFHTHDGGWFYAWRDEIKLAWGLGKLRSSLKENCPRLRRLVLTNLGDFEENPWINDSRLLEIQVSSWFFFSFFFSTVQTSC